MALLEMRDFGGYQGFDEAACREAGRMLAERYHTADPFPHVVIENLIDPSILHAVTQSFPDEAIGSYSDRGQEQRKRRFHPAECGDAITRNLFAELNSQAFLAFLTELTGLKGLIADPYYAGAGLHETKRGGYLGIHADFNWHEEMNVERRLNLLIYLNEGWDASYGGALELWDRAMQQCRVKTLPAMARAVVFTTDLDSYHGHPDPITCPPERSRRSIATYYYQAPAITPDVERSTNFRMRPGSTDKRDWRTMLHHLSNDWVPPILRRRIPI